MSKKSATLMSTKAGATLTHAFSRITFSSSAPFAAAGFLKVFECYNEEFAPSLIKSRRNQSQIVLLLTGEHES